MHNHMCCVPGCTYINKKSGGDAALHKFPNPSKDPERFREWIHAIGGDIINQDYEYIYMNRRVCHSHFHEKYLLRCNRISVEAIPTLGLQSSIILPSSSTGGPSGVLGSIENTLISSPSISTDGNVFEVVTQKEDKENIPSNWKYTAEIKIDAVVDDNNIEILRPSKDMDISINDSLGHYKSYINVEHNYSLPHRLNKVESKTKKRKSYFETKQEKELAVEIKKLKQKLFKSKSKQLKQKREIEAAKKIYSNPNFIKTIENWSAPAKLFTLMQFREKNKMKQGRRFTHEEKILALTMLKQSPKSYRFLRKIFILPSQQILLKLISRCSLSAGINENIFKQLKLKAEKLKFEHRLCALLFDEMHLSANLFYSERKDTVSGFVTDGVETKLNLADHAQVFMIRGLVKNYKQPVAYTFSHSATKGVELAKQIRLVIEQLQQAGFLVICTICDQGTNNRLATKWLNDDYRRNCLQNENIVRNEYLFKVNDQEIVMLYDPPHLIKCLRNNLITKHLKFKLNGEEYLAKWEHIEKLYEENPGYKGLKLIPKLTENHVIPHKICKMKVKNATQVCSRTVASNMGYLADKGILPEECKHTAELLYFVDNLFDSLNGSFKKKNRHAKPLLGPVTPSSPHKKFWGEAKVTLKTMEFVNKTTGKKENVPTIDGWYKTIDGAAYLIGIFEKTYGISSIWMRHLNQDPVENFFGSIRSHGCRNNSPSPAQFESAFATLLINNMSNLYVLGANCEEDNAQLLYELLPQEDCKTRDEDNVIDFDNLNNLKIIPLNEKQHPKIMGPLKYVAGYFIKRAKCKIFKNCSICKECLQSSSADEYIKYREYSKKTWLCSPSDSVLEIMSALQDITSELIPKYIEKPNLREHISLFATVLVNMNFAKCSKHKDLLAEFILKDVLRFFIFNYCKNINKILTGQRMDLIEDDVQRLAKIYYEKHKTRNKSK